MVTDTKNKEEKVDISQDNLADLRNYLAIILLSAELLLEQEEGFSEKVQKWLEVIKEQVWRIDKLFPKFDVHTSSYRDFLKQDGLNYQRKNAGLSQN